MDQRNYYMLFAYLAFLLTLSLASSFHRSEASALRNRNDIECDMNQWQEFKIRFEKKYQSFEEEVRRMLLFCKNFRLIEEINSNENSTYKAALNHMSDQSEDENLNTRILGNEEATQFRSMKNRPGLGSPDVRLEADELPDFMADYMDREPPNEWDWRSDKRVVGPIMDQVRCGACWAFATAGLIEGQQHKIDPNLSEVVSLSAQQLVDCDNELNSGCNRGLVVQTSNYLSSFGGLQREIDYPFKSGWTEMAGKCKHNASAIQETSRGLNEFLVIKPKDEQFLKRLVAFYGPVAVSIHARMRFLHYYDGIFEDETCKPQSYPNHALLIVGYGTDSYTKQDYWIVKNSFGQEWGMKGYGYVLRKDNHCSIANRPTVVINSSAQKPTSSYQVYLSPLE